MSIPESTEASRDPIQHLGQDLDRVSRFTVLTVNTHKGFTALNRRFILPELREAVRSVSADVVFLQEVHGTHEHHPQRYSNWPSMPQYEFLADSLWPQFAYGRNAVYPAGDHGNALLSKFQIIRHDNIDVSISGHESRGMLHSVLRLPGADGPQVHAICVHLGLREGHRVEQLQLLCQRLSELPPEAPVIVAGDFNDWRGKASELLKPCGLREVFAERLGKPARSFPARLPILRLDRIYVRNLKAHHPKVLSVRPWSHLSDHAPLSVEIEL
ncbi:endonuclease/exonuclease/phosphatase family protein [Pseudomonas bijieensis]|jgi:endonuclease/exonuclease/phosphatase family metal-dependent hydrolase|uniref:Endonuclease/exonuclease/phosphatase family protein n=1 Tax=Pseudomonas bijieensis TaxID=2681983 RepID=A0A6N1CS68_9PSED|nr:MULTISPECIES: endonuclease/exonuclease/phosphatase family protein [Pseudomonas]AXP05544.1 EEP domain-containing protein [Pseudomonas fluorescens]MCD9118811.1 endonuclease/exonuclease/phosphatase family protein [Pseudomonas bijieensis]PWJ28432.1 endonuclease/exonuclease/phosphatase family metal-dependent hydrolase [Pseudomonas sp. 43mfcvi1.1]QIB06496.1 endonuclease/exonuclease/phosphatase family protein [Pseudomonas fluorescens]QKS84393.1 endonuclease/exonuclease/phosphatase family protein [